MTFFYISHHFIVNGHYNTSCDVTRESFRNIKYVLKYKNKVLKANSKNYTTCALDLLWKWFTNFFLFY